MVKSFQSTPSVGRATRAGKGAPCQSEISIHALRGEGDVTIFSKHIKSKSFQSTPSVGRATNNTNKELIYRSISIHALRGEGDVSICAPG